MKQVLHLGVVFGSLLLPSAVAADQQQHNQLDSRPAHQQRDEKQANRFGQPREGAMRNGKDRRPPPPPFVPPHLVMERISRMSPEERRRMLDRLPPDKRQITEERLRQLDSMPSEARERLRKEFNDFQSLTPEKQQELRGLFQRFSSIPQNRRPDMRRELGRLRSMPPAQRAARIGDENFRAEFNDDEREILQGLVEILPPPPPPMRGLRPRPDKPESAN